ncbi:MAG: HEPN domain-containing protein [Deltaproteobacteria bacterium]|nr:HEPN domain-containing protein [Deltaproteobacteria bacterium]
MRPPEEVKRKLVQQWMAKAEEDISAAEALLLREWPLLYPSCFHSQQAAEKYIKAFLTQYQVEFPKTHAFGELLDLVSQVDGNLATLLRDVTALNPYGVEVRYPGDAPEPTCAEAQEALELARKVCSAIHNALKGRA